MQQLATDLLAAPACTAAGVLLPAYRCSAHCRSQLRPPLPAPPLAVRCCLPQLKHYLRQQQAAIAALESSLASMAAVINDTCSCEEVNQPSEHDEEQEEEQQHGNDVHHSVDAGPSASA